MLNLAGYQETETLYTGTRTIVYRALRLSDRQPVIIKILRNPHPNFNELVQFRNQYVITQNLDSPYIVKPLALERYNNGYALVMPDEGAVALPSYWQDSEQSLKELLKIAIQLAEALHILTGQQIIHKDIKPANILIHPKTGQVQLIDFSIASLLPKEQRQLVNPKGLEGSLAYLSPEQTGRMNRGIDYRTDFYALGVTLYELWTGGLPFTVSDPLELVHCHIAQVPIAPADLLDAQGQSFSAPLSAIVMRLMAKNAEDRYQSALGLKHDLERCLRSLEETGEIVEFELGERDVCDRFNIPEKLYGRETEVQTLLDAFDRVAQGTSEMLLVAGFSGIGKTAVVNEVHKPIVRQKGYFIKGKFDQFNRNIPFSAFVQAFRDLMGQLLSESDENLIHWKAKILEVASDNGQVLIDAIPELEKVIGKQPPATELSGTAAQNRFNLLFQKFIAIFTTPEHPLVIFLDDLQWADSASLNLMKVLMGESEQGYLLLLGAYRDNEVFPAHPLMLTLADLDKQNAEISTITLEALSESHINQLVADTLSCPVAVAQPLTELVYRKTQGNPFFTTQFLKGLYEDGLIVFERELGYWECDLVHVQDAALTDSVVEFMAGRLQKLPQPTQDVLMLAACIGNQFDLETLTIVCESSAERVATELWSALREGLILPITEVYKFFQEWKKDEGKMDGVCVNYRFLHDRVQQAAYSLIPDPEKQTTHYRIGQRLLHNTPPEIREEQISELVGQLNCGTALISKQTERDELATLNLMACRKAKGATAYRAGREYAQIGFSLLGSNPWREQYELVFALTELAAEFAALCGDWEEMDRLVEEVVANSHSLVERANVYRISIQTNVSRHQMAEAISISLEFLQQLGITFPQKITEVDIANALASVKEAMVNRQVEDLLDLPEMKDPEKIAIVQIAQSILVAANLSNPQLLPLLVSLAVLLSVQYGNSPPAGHAYASYGLLLMNGAEPDVMTGAKFGQLSLQLVDKLAAKTAKPEVLCVVGGFLIHRTSSIQETLPILQEGYTCGVETGNYEFASYNARLLCCNSFWYGCSLETLVAETRAYCHSLEQLNQFTIANHIRLHWQTMLNLLEGAESPTLLSGEALQEEEALRQWQTTNDVQALFIFHSNKLMLCYLFRDLKATRVHIDEGRKYLLAAAGMVDVVTTYFYGPLSVLAGLQPDSRNSAEVFSQVETDLASLQHWADYAPMNHQHKVDLVEAEKCRVLDQKLEAIELYDRAIAGAKENGFIQEEALANELFAKFYLEWGKEKYAALHMQEAYYCYVRWGAKAKTAHLEANYPELLTPILQKQRVELNSIDRLTSLTQTLTTTFQSQTSSSSSISDALDFAAILQAAQKLSSTIDLEQLLGDIAKIILTNAGAQKIALLMPDGEQWQLQATAEQVGQGNINTQTLIHLLTAESPVPIRLIQYVKNTQEPVLISEAKTEISGILEGYLLKYQPQSVLCVPLLNQGNLVAIAYLEHPTTKGVFTPNRQTIIEFLCAQAAVALQNAQLYQQAQTALTDLQQAQLQLVQSEKMSALGNLVAGVAHEINNPVGFLQGNIQPAQDYVQDLLGLIDVYRTEYPQANEAVDGEVEAIDLDFVREDLPKLIGSMNAGVDRIRNISDSLRTFSRKDQEHKTAFNLHDGIDSTLLILKHRTKANEKRPKVGVLKNYGELPEVQCFPGQLNQVFMNILANAIDAFDEANQGKTYEEIEANPNQIMITTSTVNEQVQIQIQDNGCGMKPETAARIFEQGFTTKAVSKGTGLGMAIARQILEEKHGGTVRCSSQLSQGSIFTITLPIN